MQALWRLALKYAPVAAYLVRVGFLRWRRPREEVFK